MQNEREARSVKNNILFYLLEKVQEKHSYNSFTSKREEKNFIFASLNIMDPFW